MDSRLIFRPLLQSDVATHRDVYELTKDVSLSNKTNLAVVSMLRVGKSAPS